MKPSFTISPTFYMVYNLTKGGAPSKKHRTMDDAVKEAVRLAKIQAGEQFVILRSVESYLVDVPEPRRILHNDTNNITATITGAPGAIPCSTL